jgi:mRNA-degrading endonuclease RelE of RelBE toxin-antitoxin system
VKTDRLAKGRYAIRFSNEASTHLSSLTARQRATLLDSTERQLSHQPTLETRRRKPMQPGKEGFVAPWELRVGDLRLYYETHETPQRLVVVVAVGVKVRNRLHVAGTEYEP